MDSVISVRAYRTAVRYVLRVAAVGMHGGVIVLLRVMRGCVIFRVNTDIFSESTVTRVSSRCALFYRAAGHPDRLTEVGMSVRAQQDTCMIGQRAAGQKRDPVRCPAPLALLLPFFCCPSAIK